MAINLVTLAEYKAYASISNPNHDAEINSLIPKISALVKSYCVTSFVDYYEEDKIEYFNGDVLNFILKEGPLVGISSVEYSSDYGQTYTPLVEFVDWVEDNGCILSINASGFARQLRGYKISYRAGYEFLPEDLKLAILDLITYYRRNDGAIHSPKAPGTNSVQIEYITTTSLPAHIRRVLDLYKGDFT